MWFTYGFTVGLLQATFSFGIILVNKVLFLSYPFPIFVTFISTIFGVATAFAMLYFMPEKFTYWNSQKWSEQKKDLRPVEGTNDIKQVVGEEEEEKSIFLRMSTAMFVAPTATLSTPEEDIAPALLPLTIPGLEKKSRTDGSTIVSPNNKVDWIPKKTENLETPPKKTEDYSVFWYTGWIGVFFALNVVTGNVAFLFCPLGLMQMVKHWNVFISYPIGMFFGVDRFLWEKAFTISLIISTAMLVAWGAMLVEPGNTLSGYAAVFGVFIGILSQLFTIMNVTLERMLMTRADTKQKSSNLELENRHPLEVFSPSHPLSIEKNTTTIIKGKTGSSSTAGSTGVPSSTEESGNEDEPNKIDIANAVKEKLDRVSDDEDKEKTNQKKASLSKFIDNLIQDGNEMSNQKTDDIKRNQLAIIIAEEQLATGPEMDPYSLYLITCMWAMFVLGILVCLNPVFAVVYNYCSAHPGTCRLSNDRLSSNMTLYTMDKHGVKEPVIFSDYIYDFTGVLIPGLFANMKFVMLNSLFGMGLNVTRLMFLSGHKTTELFIIGIIKDICIILISAWMYGERYSVMQILGCTGTIYFSISYFCVAEKFSVAEAEQDKKDSIEDAIKDSTGELSGRELSSHASGVTSPDHHTFLLTAAAQKSSKKGIAQGYDNTCEEPLLVESDQEASLSDEDAVLDGIVGDHSPTERTEFSNVGEEEEFEQPFRTKVLNFHLKYHLLTGGAISFLLWTISSLFYGSPSKPTKIMVNGAMSFIQIDFEDNLGSTAPSLGSTDLGHHINRDPYSTNNEVPSLTLIGAGSRFLRREQNGIFVNDFEYEHAADYENTYGPSSLTEVQSSLKNDGVANSATSGTYKNRAVGETGEKDGQEAVRSVQEKWNLDENNSEINDDANSEMNDHKNYSIAIGPNGEMEDEE